MYPEDEVNRSRGDVPSSVDVRKQTPPSPPDDFESDGPSYSHRRSATAPSPMMAVALRRWRWGRLLMLLWIIGGLVVQMALLGLAYELWDLAVSLMELWGELARLHLDVVST